MTLDTRTTFGQLDAASRRLARAFVAAGVGKGSRIGAQFSYGAEWLVAFLAATRVGAIFVPLSTAYKPAELRKTVRHADLAVLVSPRRLFGTDRLDVLEETLPGLASQPADRLALPGRPICGSVDRRRRRPSLGDSRGPATRCRHRRPRRAHRRHRRAPRRHGGRDHARRPRRLRSTRRARPPSRRASSTPTARWPARRGR